MEKNGRAAWEKAWITNDFIFGNVMQEGDNCLNLLRATPVGVEPAKGAFKYAKKPS